MYGAILGDMIGAPYEFDMGDKTKDFPLFSERSEFTDDSVMTIAVAEALLAEQPAEDHQDPEIERRLVGIGLSMVGKSEQMTFAEGFIRNAEVPQFIGGRDITQRHER